MTARRRKRIACIALAAMLFGAVSPALAAALFHDRPEIMGRLLSIPLAPTHAAEQTAMAAEREACPLEFDAAAADREVSHSAHDGAAGGSHSGSEHAAHGIFCSFCLAANSVTAVPTAVGTELQFTVDLTAYAAATDDRRPGWLLPVVLHSRDPPADLSRSRL